MLRLALASLMAVVIGTPCAAQNGPRMALLIGNWDYNGNQTFDPKDVNVPNPHNYLPDLKNPCSDVESVEAQLIILGWKEDEIQKVCNKNRLEIIGLIDEFSGKFTAADDPLGFIYYSGHGLQVQSTNYIFGVKDSIDVPGTARLIELKPKADPLPASGVDIVTRLTLKLGRIYSGAMLLALDACRDNPVLDFIRNQKKAIPVTAPQPAKELQGMVIAYSTTAGKTADDGLGSMSPFAEVFTKAMKANASLDEILNQAAYDLDQSTADTDRWQTPSRQGTFPPPRRCFSTQCVQPTFGLKLDKRIQFASFDGGGYGGFASTSFAATDMLPVVLKIENGRTGLARNSISSRIKPKMIFESPLKRDVSQSARSLGVRVDVIWCEGNLASEANRMKAEDVAARISALSNASTFAKAEIASVWVTPLNSELNAQPGFGYSDNVITYSSDDPRSVRLVREIKSRVAPEFREDAYLENSGSLITVYVCKGAVSERPSRLYFHIPKESLRAYASSLLEDVQSNYTEVAVARGIQKVNVAPRITQVRYFHTEDAELANKIVERISEFAKIPVKAAHFKGYEKSAKKGHLEVWLASDLSSLNSNSPSAI